jgi:hypothetical protein
VNGAQALAMEMHDAVAADEFSLSRHDATADGFRFSHSILLAGTVGSVGLLCAEAKRANGGYRQNHREDLKPAIRF